MEKIRLFLKDRSYDIHISDGLIARSGPLVKRLGVGNDAIVITNKTLWSLYGKALRLSLARSGINVHHKLVPDSERAKSFDILKSLLNSISLLAPCKRPFIVALGGGVIGDLAGFAAAIYKRGIPYIQIPTTLLAQVDSAIGGKTAIDLPVAKNLVGAFYQPRAVLSDIAVLRSLPNRELRNGLAEVVKYGVIKDRRLFEYLEKNYQKILARDGKALRFIVKRSSAIKAGVVEKDEYDRMDVRAILNYGHTIGHAIEAASDYGEEYYHGEAIAIGMVAAARIAIRLKMLSAANAERIECLIKRIGLPTRAKRLNGARLYRAFLRDKKFIRGANRFILPIRIGHVRIVEAVPERLVRQAMKQCVQA